MENKSKSSGNSKLFTAVLSILLVVSIVLNVVLYLNNNDLHQQITALTADNQSISKALDTASASAAQGESDLQAANQTIEQMTQEATDSQEALIALQAEYDTYQADMQASLDAAVQQGKDDVKAAQDESAAQLAALQTDFDTYKAEMEASLQALLQDKEDSVAQDIVTEEEMQQDPVPMAEPTAEEVPAQAPAVSFAGDDVVATVNGEPVTGDDVMENYQYVVNSYGEPDADNLELYYAVSMGQAVTLSLIKQTAASMGVDQYTQEEIDELNEASDSEWTYALDNYVSYNYTFTDETTEDEKTAAYAEAEAYYSEMGYTQETLRQSYLENDLFERVKAALCKDVVVTDDDVLAYYDTAVANDKEAYEFNVDAYENQLMMYQYGYATQEPWYHPEGYRYVKHILLSVDEDVMAAYTDLLSRYEEQQTNTTDTTTADTGDTTAAETPADETAAADTPVTAEDVAAAKDVVIASVQTQLDEINAKLADGASFDDLVAAYGTDPGMTSGDYPDGYEVSQSSVGFIPEFVAGAFSVDQIGDVSEPIVSQYGVHIIQYAGDVPAGPIALTDALKASIHDTLESEQCDAVLEAWHSSADIQYSGIIRSVEEIQAAETDTVPAQ